MDERLEEVVGRLASLEEIRLLKARYLRFIDQKQWEALPRLFAENAVFTTAAGVEHHSPQGITDFLSKALGDPNKHSEHHGHMPEIEFLEHDRASGIWALYEVSESPGQPQKILFGHYHDEYVREGGSWKILTTRVVRPPG